MSTHLPMNTFLKSDEFDAGLVGLKDHVGIKGSDSLARGTPGWAISTTHKRN
jgi:hypothetical protein